MSINDTDGQEKLKSFFYFGKYTVLIFFYILVINILERVINIKTEKKIDAEACRYLYIYILVCQLICFCWPSKILNLSQANLKLG